MFDDSWRGEEWRNEGFLHRFLRPRSLQLLGVCLMVVGLWRWKTYIERMNRRLLTLEAILLDPPRGPLGG